MNQGGFIILLINYNYFMPLFLCGLCIAAKPTNDTNLRKLTMIELLVRIRILEG